MKLITENIEDIQILTEEKDGKQHLYIEGVFLQSEIKNRNGRIYPFSVLEKEVGRYNEEYVSKGRALGELGHPDGPQLNLERVSHLIKELRVDGNDIYGKAKILDTPYGKIVKDLIKEGVKIGVSSRGMGSLKQVNGVNEVQEDFNLAAVDIVADPSAPNAFVNGVMEGVEWIYDAASNSWKSQAVIEEIVKTGNVNARELQENKVRLFEKFLNTL